MHKTLTAALGVAALLGGASPAPAQDNDGACRASAARVEPVDPLPVVEPVRANAPATPCSSQSAAVSEPETIGPVTADAVGAFTDRSGAAFASAAHATAVLGPLTVAVTAVEARATAPCGTTPAGTSRVAGLTINGQAIVLPPGDAPVNIPLGPLGSVSLNKETVENGVLTRRAVEVVSPLATVVLAEAVAKAATCPKATIRDGGNGGGVPPVCPDGATYDPERNVCVVRDGDNGNGSNNTGGGSGAGDNGTGDVPAGRPFEGPSGGTVLTLSDARAKYKSACLKGAGPAFAIVGTKGKDNITGTNERDRILLLAGTDKSEGGRGDDCIDGGKGRDTMSGALGNDKLIGGRGNDALVGGSHNDRLIAGRGNDTINSGFGKDRIRAGRGADRINVATAGPAVKQISCGKGRDKVRLNRNEKRKAARRKNGCEKVYSIR